MRRRLAAVALSAALFASPCLASAPASATRAATPGHYQGTLADGATWVGDVPSRWNGRLVLYSHGLGDLTAADSPDAETTAALLDRGYALVGTSYDPNGPEWALNSAVRDQLAGLTAMERITGSARVTLALGSSMGGLVTGLLAQKPKGRIDGAVSTCGQLAGGIDLNNLQLDGEYALSRLVLPTQNVKLVRYASAAEAQAAATQLTEAATAARDTPAGRARVALATAFLNLPTWSQSQAQRPGPQAVEDRAQAQYDWLIDGLPFIIGARYSVERAARGNASWNNGVDYAKLLARSPYRDQVRALYRTAGLNLNTDLTNLTRNTKTRADSRAMTSLTATSTLTGHLDVPHLTLHNLYDHLAPVEVENQYAKQVRAAKKDGLLRQAYVNRRGHCAFTPSEIVAALDAVTHRVTTGHWNSAAKTRTLQAAARAIGLADGPAFVDYRPGTLVNHRRWH
jgi:pimeloyl-ACP methyl ester carboxylesterase